MFSPTLSLYIFDSLLKAVWRACKFLSRKSSENLPLKRLIKSSFSKATFTSFTVSKVYFWQRGSFILFIKVDKKWFFFIRHFCFGGMACFHYSSSCCRMFWFVLNFRWIWLDKRKNVSKIYSRCGVLLCFLTWNIRFLLQKQKNSNWFDFFVSVTKDFRIKVAKQRNLTWGHAKTFIGNCNMCRFLLPSHKNCFLVSLA